MGGEDRAAVENARCLEQGVDSIRHLDDDLFAASPGARHPGGVAPSTLRHRQATGPSADR